jgi:hypothetical protein
MEYAVADVEKKTVEVILNDDFLSRQSVTVKDSKLFGSEKDSSYVLIEGNDGIKERLKKIGVSILEEKKAAEVREKIKKEEDEAAGGLGFLFS